MARDQQAILRYTNLIASPFSRVGNASSARRVLEATDQIVRKLYHCETNRVSP